MSEVFLKVLNMSITAGYVILFILFFRLLLKKAPKNLSYVLWSVAAFRLVVPYSFKSILSLLPINSNVIPQDIAYSQNPGINSGIESIDLFVSRSLPSPVVGASVNPLQVYSYIGSYIWILGLILFLLYGIVSVLLLKIKLKDAKEIEENVFEADNLKTPFLFGAISPKIYLPTGLGEDETRYILLHEINHVKRKDHLVKVFAFVILAVHWFNPLVWIAFILMSTDMELSCDQRVLATAEGNIKKPYANTLLTLAAKGNVLRAGPLAFGEGNMKDRIKNVLNHKKPSLWIIVLALLLTVVVSIGLIADPKEKELNENSVSYEIIKIVNGKEVHELDPVYAEDIVMGYMLSSSRLPGFDISLLNEYYLIHAAYEEGIVSDYYAFFYEGNAVVQGVDGYYCRVDNELLKKLTVFDVSINMMNEITVSDYISKAILEENTDRHSNDDYATTAYSVLETVEKDNIVEVYAMVLYMEFEFDGGGFDQSRGSHMPVAMTFEKKKTGEYVLVDYWRPMDGSYYAPTIEERFPPQIYQEALDTQKYIVSHMQSCYEQVVEYAEVDTEHVIGKLFNEIMSSPAYMSDYTAYINEHIYEYRELIYYGKYTLGYCFDLFEKGDQSGLKGHIMASVLRDILGIKEDEGVDNTGQDWYDNYIKNQKNTKG